MLLLGRRKEQVRHEKALIVNAIVQRKRSMCIYRTRINAHSSRKSSYEVRSFRHTGFNLFLKLKNKPFDYGENASRTLQSRYNEDIGAQSTGKWEAPRNQPCYGYLPRRSTFHTYLSL